jgi:hypothetical protein
MALLLATTPFDTADNNLISRRPHKFLATGGIEMYGKVVFLTDTCLFTVNFRNPFFSALKRRDLAVDYPSVAPVDPCTSE